MSALTPMATVLRLRSAKGSWTDDAEGRDALMTAFSQPARAMAVTTTLDRMALSVDVEGRLIGRDVLSRPSAMVEREFFDRLLVVAYLLLNPPEWVALQRQPGVGRWTERLRAAGRFAAFERDVFEGEEE